MGSSFPFGGAGPPGNIPRICPFLHSQDTRVSAWIRFVLGYLAGKFPGVLLEDQHLLGSWVFGVTQTTLELVNFLRRSFSATCRDKGGSEIIDPGSLYHCLQTTPCMRAPWLQTLQRTSEANPTIVPYLQYLAVTKSQCTWLVL